MADKTWIVWLVGIASAVIVLLFAILKGRAVAVGGKGMTLKVDGQTPRSVTPGIKAHLIKAGRDFVAHDETGQGIDAVSVDAGRDADMHVRGESDPKGK